MCTNCAKLSGWKILEKPKHQLSKGEQWVEVIAEIRHNETGEIRRYTASEILGDGEAHPSVFNWAENNYSCDCNRELFFGYAIGQSMEEIDRDDACSEGRYSVRLINPVDNQAYYAEF